MPGVMRALTQHCGGTVTAPPMPCASPPQPSFQPPICFPPPSSAFYPNLTLSAGSCPPAFSIFYKLFLGGGGRAGSLLAASRAPPTVVPMSSPCLSHTPYLSSAHFSLCYRNRSCRHHQGLPCGWTQRSPPPPPRPPWSLCGVSPWRLTPSLA